MFFMLVFIQDKLSTCFGQDKKNHSFVLYLNAPSMTKIVTDKADEISIKDVVWAADMGLEFRFFTYSGLTLGVGFGSAKDYNSFTQNTTMGEKESSFNFFLYDLKAGFWSPDIKLLKKRDLVMNLRANAGYEGMTGKREIDDCTNCQEEKYGFEAGLFLEPEINFFFYRNLIGLGSAYRFYLMEADTQYKIVLLKIMLRLDY